MIDETRPGSNVTHLACFCGGIPRIVENRYNSTKADDCSMGCTKCSCVEVHGATEDEAREKWNSLVRQGISSEQRDKISGVLDMLGVALATHSHKWTEAERGGYNEAISVLA